MLVAFKFLKLTDADEDVIDEKAVPHLVLSFKSDSDTKYRFNASLASSPILVYLKLRLNTS